MTTKLIGQVGVDSGQLLLCDPCYIDSQWTDDQFQDIRIFEHKTTKERLQYQVDFENFATPIAKHDGKDMNALLKTGEWDQVEAPAPDTDFSYNACCHATLSKKGHGELGNNLGVAFSTAFGDGVYPVYATYDDNGDLVCVSVYFQDTDEEDS